MTNKNKTLYTQAEVNLIQKLLLRTMTQESYNILTKLFHKHSAREHRIILNKPSQNDIKNGFNQKNYPWLNLSTQK